MQILIFVCLFVLFSSSSPIFLEGASTRTDFDRGMGLYPISLNYNWEKSWDTSLKLEVPMTCTCPPPKPICESSYKEISLAFSQKIYADTLKFYSDAQRVLNNSWVCTATTLREIGLEAIDYTLWLLVYVWSSLIWVSLSWIWWLVVNFTTPVFYLASLFVLTKFTVKVVRYVFGGLPVQILKFFWKLLKIIYQTASSKPNCAYEKAVDGFVSYTIPQSPPKSSVLEIVYPSGNHAGYASCIKLYNGENALLTATHVLKASGELLVKSTKMNFKIPLSEFKTIIGNTKGDVTIMRGPPNWEGLLGCKAADIITVRNLAKCKATIFHLRENEWYSSYAEIVGNDGVNVTVLSNTESGHSGSPYFNGKYILGVHSGASVEDNCNFMAPIPAIPGLTMPSYVFETTAPQGKIFSENEIIEIENLYPKVNAWGMTKEDVDRMVNYKPLPGKKRWADEEDKFPEAKPDVSGNGESGADRETTGSSFIQQKNEGGIKILQSAVTPALATPTPPVMTDQGAFAPLKPAMVEDTSVMEKIIQTLVDKINVVEIEKKVVEKISTKALKKPQGPPKRQRRKRSNSSDISPNNTSGRYQPPHVRSPGSAKAESYPSSTIQNKKKNRNGGSGSSGNIQRWVRKPAVSDGQSSAQKPSSKA
ncbi:TPA_asm: P1 protein [Kalanchoe marnieriana polerovirus]|uniref:P1 protein n=1 Tax=Kalanchoe marnieriana polerovirus TaxID=2885086 RepID=A0AAD2KQ56_9VIRU|nr:TPA_asm: P1 protein [Kalanchoe marnieriana polerovirus]